MRKSTKERLYGISGALVAFQWIFTGTCRVLDWISRGQTAMNLSSHLSEFLTSPLTFLVSVPATAFLIFKATQLEKDREEDETPRIIMAWSEPAKPRYQWSWLKMAGGVIIFSVLLALGYAAKFRLTVSPLPPFNPPHVGLPTDLLKPQRRPIQTQRIILSIPTSTKDAAAVSPQDLRPLPAPSATLEPRGITPSSINAPIGIIPQDPLKASHVVEDMRNGLIDAIENKDTITFLFSWSTEEGRMFEPDFDTLISSACRVKPRQCFFVSGEGGKNLDKPAIKGSARRGLTVHGDGADKLAQALGKWFENV